MSRVSLLYAPCCVLQSFKRRYFYLKQQADTTYILEMHKDDRRLDAKGSIFLDSATDVIRVSHQHKSCPISDFTGN